jgi:RteC protein
MKENWSELFNEMTREMESCRKRGADQRSEIECRFSISLKYWAKIQNGIADMQFDNNLDEIEFYKTVKPLFKSQIEYYNLVYQTEILHPADKQELKEFWIREQQRLDKFIIQHRDFYQYYKSGATNRDENMFLVTGHKDDNGNAFFYDDLIATLLALEKYHLYTTNKLLGL